MKRANSFANTWFAEKEEIARSSVCATAGSDAIAAATTAVATVKIFVSFTIITALLVK
jgi:hypothetical protein